MEVGNKSGIEKLLKIRQYSEIDFDTILLIPIFDIEKQFTGISHLFEHLLINYIHIGSPSKSCITGHTTEDYMIFQISLFEKEYIIRKLKNMKIFDKNFLKEKKRVLSEISIKSNDVDERFFKKVWKNTKYEFGPLGTKDCINKITKQDILDYKNLVTESCLYFYCKKDGLICYNEKPICITEHVNNIIECKDFKFDNKHYRVYYFNQMSEVIYLAEKILSINNPGKFVQVSEKKDKLAIIIEKGIVFVKKVNLRQLVLKVKKEIMYDIEEIKTNFVDRAINELESIFFTNQTWSERIESFNKISLNDIYSILNILEQNYEKSVRVY